MKKSCLFAVSALLLLLGGCYGDKGNYDYREINEIVIGARGFEGVEYKLRSGIDELKISPYITASQDPGLTGSYEYEWVVVGQVRNPGERTTIARTRDLDYAVNLPSDDYSLLLRITDPATGLMFSRSTTISVSTAYTRGWLVAAEDEEGAAVVDMVSISRDTLLQRDVVRDDTRHRNPLRIWCDNNEYTSLVHGRIYLSTGEGSFLYDRESFGTDDYTVMRNYFANPQYLTETAASDMIQIDDKFRIFLVDGYAYVYSISSVNTGYFGNPVNRYAESYDYVRIGDRIAYNLSGGSGAGSITTVMLCMTPAVTTVKKPPLAVKKVRLAPVQKQLPRKFPSTRADNMETTINNRQVMGMVGMGMGMVGRVRRDGWRGHWNGWDGHGNGWEGSPCRNGTTQRQLCRSCVFIAQGCGRSSLPWVATH